VASSSSCSLTEKICRRWHSCSARVL